MMDQDEYLDQYFSSSSWSDANAKVRSTWDYGEQQNELLPVTLGIYEDDEKSSPVSIVSASHTMENLAAQDTSSVVLGGESDYNVHKTSLSGEVPPPKDYQNCNSNNLSSDGKISGSLKLGNVGLQCDTANPTLGLLNCGSPKQFSMPRDMISRLSHIELGHFGGNDTELYEIQKSLRDLQTLSPAPELWLPPSYEEVSSLSPVMGQDRNQGFGLQGVKLNNDSGTMGNRYVGIHKILQFDSLSPVNMKSMGHLSKAYSIPRTCKTRVAKSSIIFFCCWISGDNFTRWMCISAAGAYHVKMTSNTPTGGYNGSGKPRARARRGQATDPHSIAERLRREKIAERMKNLQELVPNSNKTDKASMLDEIIDYVKFLQLQVKVLSMSRLGAAGAVLPLITDGQAEGSNGLALSPPAGQGIDLSLNPDQVAFEEEAVKLMESNVTMAMQYLQSKGLCLMPIALASAISSGKASSSGTASEESKTFGFSNSVVQNNSSSSSSSNSSLRSDGIGMQQMCSDGNNIIIGKPIREAIVLNGCNGTVKQELRNTISTIEELKPKT